MRKAWPVFEVVFSVTLVLLFGGSARVLPLENDFRLASAYSLPQKGQEPRRASPARPPLFPLLNKEGTKGRLFGDYLLRQTSERPAQAVTPSEPPPLPLDINLAAAGDFEKLPGIGPKLAQRIVAYRQKHGPFRRVEDLMVVKGVGIKKWKAIRPYLRVEGQKPKR